MNKLTSLILLLAAILIGVITFVGDDSALSDLRKVQRAEEAQTRKNATLQGEVAALSREVEQLEGSPRALEKAARQELGMARADELVVIFEQKDKQRSGNK